MLFYPPEMNIQFMKMRQKSSKGCSFSHLCKGIYIFREALATITELSIRARDISMSVVDIAGEKHTCVNLSPIGPHLLAILSAGIEVSYLISAENVVHIFG